MIPEWFVIRSWGLNHINMSSVRKSRRTIFERELIESRYSSVPIKRSRSGLMIAVVRNINRADYLVLLEFLQLFFNLNKISSFISLFYCLIFTNPTLTSLWNPNYENSKEFKK
jgi:hypothetical protein